jgi:hypothetical protein
MLITGLRIRENLPKTIPVIKLFVVSFVGFTVLLVHVVTNVKRNSNKNQQNA